MFCCHIYRVHRRKFCEWGLISSRCWDECWIWVSLEEKEYLITASSHYSFTWHCHNNTALLKPCLTLSSSPCLTLCFSFLSLLWHSLSLSLKVYSYCLKVHTFSLVAAVHFFFFLLHPPLFLPCVLLHIRDPERGPFVSDFAPKAVVLQGRLIITEYTTSGKTISTSLMSNMRETKITKKKKKDDEERSWKMVFLSRCLSLSLFLAEFPAIVAVYCFTMH